MEDYLRTDGVLILKLIRLNMGVHVSRQLVMSLFPLFHESAQRALEIRDVERAGRRGVSPTTTTASRESSVASPSKFRPLIMAEKDEEESIGFAPKTSNV